MAASITKVGTSFSALAYITGRKLYVLYERKKAVWTTASGKGG